MKLRGGKNKSLFTIAALFGVAFSYAPKPKFKTSKLWGNWHYTSVVKNGIQILPYPNVNDTMHLYNQKKPQFQYRIHAWNKFEQGLVSIISVPADSSPYHKALEFSYWPFDKKPRRFHIMHLSDSLVIREGKTWFHYHKIHP